MQRTHRCSRALSCALWALAAWPAAARDGTSWYEAPPEAETICPTCQARPLESTDCISASAIGQPLAEAFAPCSLPTVAWAEWVEEYATQLEQPNPIVDDRPSFSDSPADVRPIDAQIPESWSWQWLPTGLIYRSYLAGVHEPRMAIVSFYEAGVRTLWDATLGGRVGILRFGDCEPLHPQGYQLDFYGAAIARLDVEHRQDLDSTDYVFGVPLTYGIDNWQFKFGYAHLSSHLGDELALRVPGTLDNRVNYVRDSLVFGTSCYPNPAWRQYAEVGWAFHRDGGAQPWDMQFGSELSLPGWTTAMGLPFFAIHGQLREEHNFGGDLAVQIGWLRRGEFGQTLRFGAHYFNGKSSQFQFFDNSEEQIGVGLWYDL